MNPKLLIFLLLPLAFFSANGQDYIANTRHIGLPEGLSHQHTKCFHQDKNGLIWIGTHYGLNRFDGHIFDTWTQLKDGIATSDVNYLLEDKAGWIWAITTKKRTRSDNVKHISLVHSVTGEVADFKKHIGHIPFQLSEVTHFFASPDRTLFFVTQDDFWKYLPGQGYVELTFPKGTKPLNSFDGKTFWGMQSNALVHFNETGSVIQRIPHNLAGEVLELEGNGRDIWLRELDRPLIHFSIESGAATPAFKGTDNWYNKPWFFDKKRNWAWIAKKTNLLAYDASGNKVFDLEENHTTTLNAQIISIYVDEDGLLWLGTFYGVHMLEIKPTHFKRYLFTPNKNLLEVGDYPCRGLLGVGSNLFVNTYEHTFRVDLGQESIAKLDRSKYFKKSKHPFAFLQTRDGQVWTGSSHLARMDAETGEIVEKIEVPDIGYRMWAIHQDRNGVIWLSKGKGIFTFKEGVINTFRAYNGFSMLENSLVYFYHETRDGMLWLGTNNGLFAVDLEHGVTDRFWSKGKGDYHLPASQIQFIHEDDEGFFWMATESEGLVKWHPQTKYTRRLTRSDGLPTNTIYGIYEDEKGFLWMSSHFGLIQMDKHTLQKKNLSAGRWNRSPGIQSNLLLPGR